MATDLLQSGAIRAMRWISQLSPFIKESRFVSLPLIRLSENEIILALGSRGAALNPEASILRNFISYMYCTLKASGRTYHRNAA